MSNCGTRCVARAWYGSVPSTLTVSVSTRTIGLAFGSPGVTIGPPRDVLAMAFPWVVK